MTTRSERRALHAERIHEIVAELRVLEREETAHARKRRAPLGALDANVVLQEDLDIKHDPYNYHIDYSRAADPHHQTVDVLRRRPKDLNILECHSCGAGNNDWRCNGWACSELRCGKLICDDCVGSANPDVTGVPLKCRECRGVLSRFINRMVRGVVLDTRGHMRRAERDQDRVCVDAALARRDR